MTVFWEYYHAYTVTLEWKADLHRIFEYHQLSFAITVQYFWTCARPVNKCTQPSAVTVSLFVCLSLISRRPYNLYCVGADVKPRSINQSINLSLICLLSDMLKCKHWSTVDSWPHEPFIVSPLIVHCHCPWAWVCLLFTVAFTPARAIACH